MSRAQSDVIVIGAGPYGLAAAAHLSAAGANIRVFGSPMSFWTEQMPKGMLLRSPWGASHISDPKSALTLDAFEPGEAAVRCERRIDLAVEQGDQLLLHGALEHLDGMRDRRARAVRVPDDEPGRVEMVERRPAQSVDGVRWDEHR